MQYRLLTYTAQERLCSIYINTPILNVFYTLILENEAQVFDLD